MSYENPGVPLALRVAPDKGPFSCIKGGLTGPVGDSGHFKGITKSGAPR
jgi:hypothetical protein